MAIKPNSKTIGDFRRYHYRSSVGLIVMSQSATIIGIGGILHFTNIARLDDPLIWAFIAGIFLLGLSVMLMFYKAISDPLYDVLAAVMHKTGELTATTPPNPNAKRNRQTGFKTVLEAIYGGHMDNINQTFGDDSYQPKTQSQLTLSEALSHTSSAVVVLDSNKKIISANPAAPIAKRQDGTDFLALNFINEKDIDTWISESESQSINAENRWLRVSTDPRYIKNQQFFDIIASYEKGAVAETVVFLLEQSNRYRDDEEGLNFIAFAAHELRGPVTVIRGYLDVLEKELAGRLGGDEPELFNRLNVSANRLSSYINNILNVAKLDRHHLHVYLYEDAVKNIYDSIAYDMSLRAQSQQRLLTIDIPDSLPTVAADRGSIGEVIGNLVDNAIKYSNEGGVVTVKAEQKGEFVEISIIDTGIGMPASVVKNLFRKFYRSHRSRDSVSGSGIGLYICKAFIESHGGTIIVRSQEGQGSTFTFTLPVYSTVKDKLLEDGQLNQSLIRQGGGWIKNHAMYRG